MANEREGPHIIDTRFTWSGPRAQEFLEMVKEEYGFPIPYGGIRELMRLACANFISSRRKERE